MTAISSTALRWVDYNGLRVAYSLDLDGGGRAMRAPFSAFVASSIGARERVFEFCAGPGYIGFDLLSRGLCQTLVLADINPGSVECAMATVRENRLEGCVDVYQSDGLASIPPTERWDLVVGNPPQFNTVGTNAQDALIRCDPDWRIHTSFYRDVVRFLTPDAYVLLIENSYGCRYDQFGPLLRSVGLATEGTVPLFSAATSPEITCHYVAWSSPGTRPIEHSPLPVIEMGVAVRDEQPVSIPVANRSLARLSVRNDVGVDIYVELTMDGAANRPIRARIAAGEIANLPPLGLSAGRLLILNRPVKWMTACCSA